MCVWVGYPTWVLGQLHGVQGAIHIYEVFLHLSRCRGAVRTQQSELPAFSVSSARDRKTTSGRETHRGQWHSDAT